MSDRTKNVGDEGIASEKHAIEQSPQKPSPSKKPKLEEQDEDKKLADHEARIATLGMAKDKRPGTFFKKLKAEHAFLISRLDEKLDQDEAMDGDEHWKLVEVVFRAHLRKELKKEVKRVVEEAVEEEFAVIRRTLENHRRQLQAIWNVIGTAGAI